MDIVEKTQTQIMHMVLRALGAQENTLSDESGVVQRTTEEVDTQKTWHNKQGKWVVITTVTVKTNKYLISGMGDTL